MDHRRSGRLALVVAALTLLYVGRASALTLEVSVDTSVLGGTPAQLAFDLVDGDAETASSVSIYALQLTGGSLGAVSTSGGATGNPVTGATLTDVEFFNELLQDLVLGSEVRFRLDFGPGSPPEILPDAFSLFLLAPSSTSLVTTELLGDALLIVDLTGDGIVSLSGASMPNAPGVVVAATAVPEPAPLFVIALSLSLLVAMGRGRARCGLLACLPLLVLAPEPASAQTEVPVDDRVHVSFSGLVLNRTTLTFDTTATLKNVGPTTLTNPLRVVVTGVSSSRVLLANATGTTALGQPFVALPAAIKRLAPGAQAKVLLRFSNPSRVRFLFQHSVSAVCDASGCPLPRPVRPFVLPAKWVVTRDTDYIVEAHDPDSKAFVRLFFQHFRNQGAGPATARDYVAYWHNFYLGNLFPLGAGGVQTSETEISQAKRGGPYLRYEFDDGARGRRYVQVYAANGGIPSIVLTGWAKIADFPAVAPTLEAMIQSVQLPVTP